MKSNDMYTHAIVTYSKAHFLITQAQFDLIKTIQGNEEIQLEGCYIKPNNIAEKMTIDKYYQTYPDKRPPDNRNEFQEHYGGINQQIRKPTEKAKELMKKGFIEGYKKTWGGTQEQAEKRFEQVILNGPTDHLLYHRKTVEKYKERTDLNISEKEHYEHALEKLGAKV